MAMVTTDSGQAPMHILCDGLPLSGDLILWHLLYQLTSMLIIILKPLPLRTCSMFYAKTSLYPRCEVLGYIAAGWFVTGEKIDLHIKKFGVASFLTSPTFRTQPRYCCVK